MIKKILPLILLALTACTVKPNPLCEKNSTYAEFNSVQFKLEIACSYEDKKLGLMDRDFLEKDSGMIFIYDKEDYYAFWMKNTNIPLSIAFLDKDKRIVDIKNMKPHDLTPVATKTKALYAIEMNLDWFTLNKISIGDKLKIVD